MEIHTQSDQGVDLIQVKGKLDYASATEFDDAVRSLSADGQRRFLVVDFSEVTALSSPSLRALLSLAKRIQRLSGRLIIANPTDIALECLNISGFLRLSIFEVKNDTAEAVAELQAHARNQPPPPAKAATASGKPTPSRSVTSTTTATAAAQTSSPPARQPNPLLAASSAPAKDAPSPAKPTAKPADPPAATPARQPNPLLAASSPARPQRQFQSQPRPSTQQQPPADRQQAAGTASAVDGTDSGGLGTQLKEAFGFWLSKVGLKRPAQQPTAEPEVKTGQQQQSQPIQEPPAQDNETSHGLLGQLREAARYWLGRR